MRSTQTVLRRFAAISLPVLFGTVLLFWEAGMNTSQGETTASAADSLQAWDKIVTVLENPRCLNCHQVNSPRQGDASRQHVPLVVRGEDNMGVPGMRCTTCHSQSGNNPTSGVPGAPAWSLAPVEMNWQGLSSAEICQQLRDPKRNGNRNAEQLVHHFAEDNLVGWGWNPGKGRTAVSMPRAELVEHVQTWLAGGSECPK
ncbi:hypothetical protein [Dongia sp.]|uniref:hypothetical protein n=1 Tax=Dongia sp. TaxID=1977262 RepID=UPI0035ADE6AD